MSKPIAVTMGPVRDRAGDLRQAVSEGLPAPALVVGDAILLRRAAKSLGLEIAVREIADAVDAAGAPGKLPVLGGGALPVDLPIGKVDARAGQASYDYVVTVIDLALAGDVDGIVTAPIATEALKATGITCPGHTEILTDKSGTTAKTERRDYSLARGTAIWCCGLVAGEIGSYDRRR